MKPWQHRREPWKHPEVRDIHPDSGDRVASRGGVQHVVDHDGEILCGAALSGWRGQPIGEPEVPVYAGSEITCERCRASLRNRATWHVSTGTGWA